MSTFVVRFVGNPAQGYRGTARHVATGEERSFANLEALLAFVNALHAVRPHGSDEEIWDTVPDSPTDVPPDAPKVQATRRDRR